MRVPVLRHILLVAFFAALAALEIGHGIFRIDVMRARHREEVLARTEREIVALSARLRGLVRAGREHTAYLARIPEVRALLDASDPESLATSRQRLEAQLLPFLIAFRGVDAVRVLDARGAELVRCERIGAGVGAIPAALLAGGDADGRAVWPETDGENEVFVSDLVVDPGRVEVPREDRRVLHYSTAVAGSDGRVVVTMYAASLLDTVRRFAPVRGARSMLVDSAGRYLAHVDRRLETAGDRARQLAHDFPRLELQASKTVRRLDDGLDTVFTSTVRESPPWVLVTLVPGDSPDFTPSHLRGEYAWVVLSVVVITAILAAAAVFFVRLSVRSVRLEEAARQEELERRLRLSERLSSLGLLTAGVAHEINNPLEGIGNYLGLLERDSLADDDRRRYIDRVREGFRRIRTIVRDLSGFSRGTRTSDRADLGLVVRKALEMVSYSKEFRGVSVELEGLDAALPVTGEAGRLEQVFINVLHNASRAMGGSGRIRVVASRVRRPGRDSEDVEVRVEDDGPGFPEHVLERIFDPFFTTTDGTGLGLWISYGIVNAHDGTIEAHNLPSGGAVLTVCLPVADSASGDESAKDRGTTA